MDEAKKTDFSKEKSQGLHGWFARQGGAGKSKGWVDCNTCRKDPETGKKKCKSCGRKSGEERSKYPACRPTPASCGTSGKGEKWGKKTSNESLEFQDEEMTVYHGSPHKFKKFTTAKIGSGEGAQAFGWGLYFTDLESIAKYYAQTIGSCENRVINRIAREELEAFNGNLDLAIKSFEDKLKETWSDKKRVKKALQVLVTGRNLKTSECNVYTVSIHKSKTPDQYTWLEWDKALRNQSSATKIALEKQFSLPSFDEDFATAGDFYLSRAKKFGSQEKASKELLSLGIDGIKYPAESIARGRTSDTARGFNYVVFDENAINIEKKSQFENKNTMKDLITQKLHEMVEENHNELQNYMFFNNLKTLHDAIGELLEMNPQQVDQILSDGHNWALDHMATATDDIEEVYHFLNATMDGHEPDSYEGETEPGYSDDFGSVEVYRMNESEYKGKKVKLGKPMRGDVKKFKVFVKNKSGKVVKVNFGDKKMEIKRDNPKRRKSFRARHKCSQAKDRTTPKYWSCRMWSKKPVSKIV